MFIRIVSRELNGSRIIPLHREKTLGKTGIRRKNQEERENSACALSVPFW